MKTIIFAAAAAGLLASSAARAQLPPSSYAGPLDDRIMAGFRCLGTTFSKPELIVLPKFVGGNYLRAGQYVDPTTCQVGGAPLGPQF